MSCCWMSPRSRASSEGRLLLSCVLWREELVGTCGMACASPALRAAAMYVVAWEAPVDVPVPQVAELEVTCEKLHFIVGIFRICR